MTQVWMLRNSDTDIHLFNREAHIEPSVAITYSRCKDVVINRTHGMREITYTITGKRNGGEAFEDCLVFICLPVWTEPSHL